MPAAALTQMLIARGAVEPAQLDRAQRLHEYSGEALHLILAKLGLAPERDLAACLAELHGLALAGEYPDAAIVPLPAKFLRETKAIPVAEDGAMLTVAIADPADPYPLTALSQACNRPTRAVIGTPSDIEAAIDRLYGSAPVVAEIADDAGDSEDVARLRDLAAEAPVIRLVNTLIARAVDARASDIHIEPAEGALSLRIRVDGVLREIDSPPRRLQAAIVSRIKIMARLDIAERRLPQDGRIKLSVRGKDIDLRVSTLPSIHGESVVMRILDKGAVELDLAALGIDGPSLATWRGLLQRPNSVLLVTGPTGSGKTTTLYASLKEITTASRKVVTVEDPVEYRVAGVTQIQVQPQIGLSFAGVLRSILRHDPDIIMIGEIRDVETAEIAVQAALTGHLVLSTLHTNSAAATITRLLDMGMADYLITSTLSGVAAQRLVRRLCPHCREAFAPLPELVAQAGLSRLAAQPILSRPVGCGQCEGTGYRGRTTLFEVLPLSEEIRRLVLRRADAAAIHQTALAEGMRAMAEDGLAKALAGQTSLEEVLRVTREC